MTTCSQCGANFDVDDARSEYDAEFNGEFNYDDDFAGEVCGNCAMSTTQSNMNVGIAIDMMNGEEDHDDAFVERYL